MHQELGSGVSGSLVTATDKCKGPVQVLVLGTRVLHHSAGNLFFSPVLILSSLVAFLQGCSVDCREEVVWEGLGAACWPQILHVHNEMFPSLQTNTVLGILYWHNLSLWFLTCGP